MFNNLRSLLGMSRIKSAYFPALALYSLRKDCRFFLTFWMLSNRLSFMVWISCLAVITKSLLSPLLALISCNFSSASYNLVNKLLVYPPSGKPIKLGTIPGFLPLPITYLSKSPSKVNCKSNWANILSLSATFSMNNSDSAEISAMPLLRLNASILPSTESKSPLNTRKRSSTNCMVLRACINFSSMLTLL